jgi:hypothetical protein
VGTGFGQQIHRRLQHIRHIISVIP